MTLGAGHFYGGDGSADSALGSAHGMVFQIPHSRRLEALRADVLDRNRFLWDVLRSSGWRVRE